MAQWISIEEAAAKYGFETEYIWVLIEIREITVDYQRADIDIIDDESIQDFINRNKKGITLMYIEKLERYCMDKSRVCSIYASLLGKQDKEITIYKGAKHLYDTLQGKWLKQCDRVRHLEKRTCIGTNHLPCVLAEKVMYDNLEVNLINYHFPKIYR